MRSRGAPPCATDAAAVSAARAESECADSPAGKVGRSIDSPRQAEVFMPDRKTLRRAARDKRAGKSASTQAGEFVREEIRHVREAKHGARSPQQAIAIGLSKARRAGVELKPPSAQTTSPSTRTKAERDYARGHGKSAARDASPRRRAAISRALKREPRASASRRALAVQSRIAASHRSSSQRSAAAKRAARTKGPARRSAAARRAARTRSSHRRS